MSNETILAYIAAVFAPILSFMAARGTLSQSKKAQQSGDAIEFASNLVQRIQKLEESVNNLNSELRYAHDLSRVSFSYIERLLTYMIAHTETTHPDIPPVPDKIAEQISVVIPDRRV